MISKGLVKFIFFATESVSLQNLITTIVPPNFLVIMNKTLMPQHLSADEESTYLRGHMDDAMKEWFLIGHADYCTSSTMESSTFSQTSISGGMYFLFVSQPAVI